MAARAWAVALLWACASLAVDAVAGWGSKSEKELTKEADSFIAGAPEPLKPFLHTLYMEGEWNAVLNFNLLALAAIEVGRYEMAEKALDQSISRILRIYSDDPNAAKAKSLWSEESVKDFKGEPYERAMVFYYRGLLYAAKGDFQNARAAFLQADYQNTLGQKESFDSSFAYMAYLAAWASHCDGDASRAQDLARHGLKSAVDPFFKGQKVAERFPRHLSIAEVGIGPEKVTLGEAKAILGFLPTPDQSKGAKITYVRMPAEVPLEGVAASIDWVALTRGGRPIQGIIDGKVAFKASAQSTADFAGGISQVAFYGSLAALGTDRLDIAKNLGYAGAALGLIGNIASGLARSTRTEADTRYWGSLPKRVVLQAFYEERPSEEARLATSSTRSPRAPVLRVRHPACSFDLVREYSALDATSGGAGNPSPWPAEPFEDGRDDANAAFRKFLFAEFR